MTKTRTGARGSLLVRGPSRSSYPTSKPVADGLRARPGLACVHGPMVRRAACRHASAS